MRSSITPAASAALAANGQAVEDLLLRHRGGDWGDVSDQVRTVNERGLVEQFNLQSSYTLLQRPAAGRGDQSRPHR